MTHSFRLTRGADVYSALRAFAKDNDLAAAVPIACVGCLSRWRVRGADGHTIFEGEARVEIVSLTGTLSRDGMHLHIALAGEDLAVFGGHLVEGCIVNTTAEVVLQAIPGTRFTRTMDETTGYRELVIEDDG